MLDDFRRRALRQMNSKYIYGKYVRRPFHPFQSMAVMISVRRGTLQGQREERSDCGQEPGQRRFQNTRLMFRSLFYML